MRFGELIMKVASEYLIFTNHQQDKIDEWTMRFGELIIRLASDYLIFSRKAKLMKEGNV